MTRKPKVLLLTAPYYYLCAAEAEYLPPVHLLYLGSFLREQGYHVDLLDVLVEFGVQFTRDDVVVFRENFARYLSNVEEDYEVIGVSCHTSSQYLPSRDIVAICRDVFPHSTIVVGGYHPSALPYDFRYEGSPVDHVVTGEGETALLRILGAWSTNQTMPYVVYEPPILDVNVLPDIDYTLISDWSKYTYYYDFFSRGCPFPCVFCMEAVKPERRWRPLTPERAVQKVRKAVAHLGDSLLAQTRLFMINDAIFAPNKRWRTELLERLIAEDFSVDFSFFASPRIDTLDENTLLLLKEGKFLIDFPVEHGSVDMLAIMKKTRKPQRFLDMTARYMRFAHEIGLAHHTHWIYGHPGESPETARASFEFMKQVHGHNDYGMTEVFFFKLYPGSWLYENWDIVQTWGAEIVIKDYWRLEQSLDDTRYHISPSAQLSRDELMAMVDDEVLPYGKEVNQIAFSHHERCCGTLRKENAPWIL